MTSRDTIPHSLPLDGTAQRSVDPASASTVTFAAAVPTTAYTAAAPSVASASGPAPVLVGHGLVLDYGDRSATTRALDGVDVAVRPAESLAVMGPSGCGKTTLLHVLGGILRPGAGSVQHGGRDLSSLSDAARTRLRRSAFGFVFQEGRLLPELTALENVILPRLLGGARRGEATRDAAAWLDRLGLEGMHGRRPGQLSGGQAQRVAIARALAGRPSVVFADEPTGALDQSTGSAVLDVLLGAAHEAGASVVMVTHDPAVASRCERTIAMRDGRVVAEHLREGGAR